MLVLRKPASNQPQHTQGNKHGGSDRAHEVSQGMGEGAAAQHPGGKTNADRNANCGNRDNDDGSSTKCGHVRHSQKANDYGACAQARCNGGSMPSPPVIETLFELMALPAPTGQEE